MPTRSSAGYTRGTQIRADRGESAIESWRIHGMVTMASGVGCPVCWMSRRSFAGLFLAGNREVSAIVIRQVA